MYNGFTRLYKAIWYSQVGRALQQTEKLKEIPEILYETLEDDTKSIRVNSQYQEQDDTLKDNLEVMREAYEDIIQDKQRNIQNYKQVIGQLMAHVEMKKNSLKSLFQEIKQVEQLKEGADKKIESIKTKLQEVDLSDEETEQHPVYIQSVTSSKSFQTTLEEKNCRVAKLKQDIEHIQSDIESHKNALSELHRDLDKTKVEQSDVIDELNSVRV